MRLISKNDVLEREGWSSEKVTFFLGNELHLAEGSGYMLSKVDRVESSDIFFNFTTIEEAQKIKDNLEVTIKENTNEAIARFLEKKAFVPDDISMLNQLDRYKINNQLSKEIIHWINKDNINPNDKYELFTDGSLKVEGEKNIIGCSGWIRNQNGEPILEFVKNIDEKSVTSSYDFEIFGLEMGLKIAQSLGIKKLNVYSDSSGEMKTLTYMEQGFMTERMVDLAEIYLPIKNIIKDMKIKFSYIPRDYNYYADNLSKVYTEEYKEYLKTVLEEQRKNGYNPNINEPQYYTNSKIESSSEIKQDGIVFVQRYSEKTFYQFYIDMKNNTVLSVEILPLKEIKKQLLEENLTFKTDSNSMDAINLALMSKEIQKSHEKGEKTMNVVHPSLGIKCRIENIVMVTNDWKQNYINLDEQINKMDKITFLPLTNDLQKLTKKWITDNNIREHNNRNMIKI